MRDPPEVDDVPARMPHIPSWIDRPPGMEFHPDGTGGGTLVFFGCSPVTMRRQEWYRIEKRVKGGR